MSKKDSKIANFIMGGDTHSLCDVCWERSTLGQLSRGLTTRTVSGSCCGCSAPGGISSRRELSRAFLTVQAPLLLRHLKYI